MGSLLLPVRKSTTIRNLSRPIARTMLVIATLFMAGCGNVPVEPFQAFSQSLTELSEGSDKALADLVPLSERRFKRELLEELEGGGPEDGEESLLESLQITMDANSPFAVKKAPLFLKTEQFKLGVNQVTGSLRTYAQLLLQLADPDLLSQKTFDDLATNLNANASQAVRAMNTDPSASAQRDVALFSQLAVGATEAYLKSKRKSDLINILEKNQPAVAHFAEHMQRAVYIMAQATVNEYVATYPVLARKALIKNTRIKAIDEWIALDRNHIRQIKTLQALHEAYGRIPAAHAELTKVVAEPQEGLSTIISVMETGKRLQAGYDQALAANKADAAQAQADKASAQADALQAEADAAALRAGAAHIAAIQARVQADDDPDNEDKQRAAQELEEVAKELSENAAEKKAHAQEMRKTAVGMQQRANEIRKGLIGAP